MESMEDVQVAFLCDNNLLLEVDDEVVSMKFDSAKNRFIGVNALNIQEFSKFGDQICKEVNVEVISLYTTKYYPRVYYTVFRIVARTMTERQSKTYLLEQFNGTTGFVKFYLCRSFSSCLEKIDKLEED